jgi:pimeloyl-ACP methyl ester carboxylesterase
MEFRTYGKPDNPTVLLLPAEDTTGDTLYAGLKKLEAHYQLLIPTFLPGESTERRLEGIEECLSDHYSGRIWGAYGLDEGASLLLALLTRQKVRIRTAVLDGTVVLPAEPFADVPTQIVYWYGSRDKAAKKLLKTLRTQYPELHTLKLKKLGVGERFWAIRPDLAVKRLRQAFGKAKLLHLTVLLEIHAQTLWTHLTARDHAAAEKLKSPPLISAKDTTHTLLIEGTGKLSKHWSHLIQLEALEDNLTLVTHQLELSAGPTAAVSAIKAKSLLKKEHKLWRLLYGPAKRRIFPFW